MTQTIRNLYKKITNFPYIAVQYEEDVIFVWNRLYEAYRTKSIFLRAGEDYFHIIKNDVDTDLWFNGSGEEKIFFKKVVNVDTLKKARYYIVLEVFSGGLFHFDIYDKGEKVDASKESIQCYGFINKKTIN